MLAHIAISLAVTSLHTGILFLRFCRRICHPYTNWILTPGTYCRWRVMLWLTQNWALWRNPIDRRSWQEDWMFFRISCRKRALLIDGDWLSLSLTFVLWTAGLPLFFFAHEVLHAAEQESCPRPQVRKGSLHPLYEPCPWSANEYRQWLVPV